VAARGFCGVKGQTQLQSWRVTVSLLGLIVFVASARGAALGEARLNEEDLKISLWNCSASLRGGFGYKDNVLLSHTNAQGRTFWMSGAELMLFRLPTHGWQFTFFADAMDARYFDAPSVDNEQMALAVAQLSKDFGGGWKSTLGLNYLFQNQVYDNSASYYTNQTSIGLILGHTLKPRWALRKNLGAFWLEGEFSGTRQWLDAPLDNYWQLGPRAVVGYGWGRGSELALSYQFTRLDYDHRPQVSAAGMVVTNSSLALDTHVVELALTHVWDEKKRWQTMTAAGFEASLDNGSGFYNYDHYRLSQRVRYRDENWEITAQARLSPYAYSTQTVSATDPALRCKTMIGVTLRAERKLSSHVIAHASYGWERSISNLDFDDYQASTVSGGLGLTF
jgi:hypothetical protein